LENGVGLVRRFLEHSRNFLRTPKAAGYQGRRVLVLTGSSFAPTLARSTAALNRATGGQLRVAPVANRAFGESVTVAGLLCGQDLLYAAHADREARGGGPGWVDAVVVPSSALRTHTGPTDQYSLPGSIPRGGSFLDDMTLEDLARQLGVPVVPSGQNFSHLLDHLRAATSGTAFHPAGMNLPQGAYNP
jgi:NifB/MoaA-like Fe-S oxidoreductase